MGRPIKVNLTANVKDFARGMKEAATAAVTTAKEVSRAGQDMGKGITTGATPAITGFRAQFRGLGGQLRGVGRDAGGQFSQSFGQALVSSGGNPLQAFRSALAAALPLLGAAGIGAAIAVELIGGYIAAAEKREADLRKAGRALAQAQAKGFIDEAAAQDYLTTVTGKDNFGEAAITIAKAADDAGVSVDQLTSAILDGGEKSRAMLDKFYADINGGKKLINPAMSSAASLLQSSVTATREGKAAYKVMESASANVQRSISTTAAETMNTADAAERAALGAVGMVVPLSEAESNAAALRDAIHLNRREMVLNRIAAGEWAGYLADGKITADEFKQVQAFDGDNLARALHMMDRWDNLQDKQLMLKVLVSYEDERRILSHGGAGVSVP